MTPKGASEFISEPLAAGGNCRRHDPYIGIMIHPYDTATHKNGRGASPVELPSRPVCPLKNKRMLGVDIIGKASDPYMSLFKEYPDVVTVEQMSEMLGISTKTAYRLLQDNVIDHFKIGRIYKIPKFHILTYLHIIQAQH